MLLHAFWHIVSLQCAVALSDWLERFWSGGWSSAQHSAVSEAASVKTQQQSVCAVPVNDRETGIFVTPSYLSSLSPETA